MASTYNKQQSITSEKREENYSCYEKLLSLFRGRRIYPDKNTKDEEERDVNQGLDTYDSEGIPEAGLVVMASSESSPILITDGKHKFLLGARMETQSAPDKQALMKSRHFVKLTSDSNLANDMKLKDGDELLLLNGIFVPVLLHGQVLELFLKISLDGQSTNKLVMRRRDENQAWKWYELFFILSPWSETGIKVTKPKCNEMESSAMEFAESEHIYKIPETKLYLVIDETGLKAKKFEDGEHDITRVMQKRTAICQHGDEDIHYDATLRDKAMSRYISVNTKNGEIILADEPHWFQMSQLGSDTHFITKGFYLGYDHQEDKVKPVRTKYSFEEFPSPKHLNQ